MGDRPTRESPPARRSSPPPGGAHSPTSWGRSRSGRRLAGLQLARFLVVGVGNTLLSFLAYRLLLVAHVAYVEAAPLAFGVGALNGYVFNRRWTFAARDSRRARLRYVFVQLVGALSTSLIVVLCVHALGTGRVLAYVLAVPPVTLGTFLANRAWTFVDRN